MTMATNSDPLPNHNHLTTNLHPGSPITVSTIWVAIKCSPVLTTPTIRSPTHSTNGHTYKLNSALPMTTPTNHGPSLTTPTMEAPSPTNGHTHNQHSDLPMAMPTI